jgi:hypothetical protein
MQRLAPLNPPYDPELARTLARMMPPGQEPLKLFRTVAHNRHTSSTSSVAPGPTCSTSARLTPPIASS